ncbi:MAG: carbon-nitrogen hydrolase family protein [Chlorobiaceae bacterium]|nr:carbon-nitrogen hydrolase family protein [Chlorobiaceae bacterium]
MDKVAGFINTGCFREALARLYRLALKSEPLTGNLPAIKAWEKCHNAASNTRKKAEKHLSSIGNKKSQPVNLTTDQIDADPLLWLTAIDNYLYKKRILNTSPNAYLNYIRMSYAIINDGDGMVWVLPDTSIASDGKFSDQYENPEVWLRFHTIIPKDNSESIPVVVNGIPNSYHDWLSTILADDYIRIAIAHFEDKVTPKVQNREPHHFICHELSDESIRLSSALNLIKKAKQQGVHVLVMPELTITPEIRDEIINRMLRLSIQDGNSHELSVPIVVLGSYHEQFDGNWRNHSCGVLGLDGQTLFAADKRKSVSYSTSADDLQRAEWIDCAPTPFTCLSTPIGLVAITICKDMFDPGAPSTATLLNNLPLDWLLVPSMSKEIKLHKEKAKSLHNTLGTIVAVANQEMPNDHKPSRGFVHYKTCNQSESDLYLIEVKRERAKQ